MGWFMKRRMSRIAFPTSMAHHKASYRCHLLLSFPPRSCSGKPMENSVAPCLVDGLSLGADLF